MATFTFIFLVNDRLFWRDEPWNYGALDVHTFDVFLQFKRNEIVIIRGQHDSTCPRRFHYKRHQNGLNHPIKHKKRLEL